MVREARRDLVRQNLRSLVEAVDVAVRQPEEGAEAGDPGVGTDGLLDEREQSAERRRVPVHAGDLGDVDRSRVRLPVGHRNTARLGGEHERSGKIAAHLGQARVQDDPVPTGVGVEARDLFEHRTGVVHLVEQRAFHLDAQLPDGCGAEQHRVAETGCDREQLLRVHESTVERRGKPGGFGREQQHLQQRHLVAQATGAGDRVVR